MISCCIFSSINFFTLNISHCSKGVLQCVQSCTEIPGNKGIGFMFDTNYSSLGYRFITIVSCYNKKKGEKKFTFPIFESNRLNK